MKIQYASDLHLEFPENKEYLKARPLKPEGDILILAGDILPIININEHADFFDYISENFKLTYWVPGNHEYYHSDISAINMYNRQKIRENIFLVNNESIIHGGLHLIFSTLWTHISAANGFEIMIRYSDFHVIRNGRQMLTTEHYNKIHENCLSFIKEELSGQKKGITIITSHHMPTFLNYPDEYKGNILNEAFAVELSELIKAAKPDYWIFGHHHSNKGDFTIGNTKLVTNQLGYIMYNEQKGFSLNKIIEL